MLGLFDDLKAAEVRERNWWLLRQRPNAFPRIATRSRCKEHQVKREQEYPDARGIPLKIYGKTAQGVLLPSGRRYAIDSHGAWIRVEAEETFTK